jgi:hypothetical protein
MPFAWLVFLPFLLVGLALIVAGSRTSPEERFKRGVWRVGGVFAIVSATVAAIQTRLETKHFIDRARRGDVLIVEGRVTDFIAGAASGHPPESFQVAGRWYRYSPYELVPGFHQVAANGGPLREGVIVRIGDVDGRIARLKVSR